MDNKQIVEAMNGAIDALFAVGVKYDSPKVERLRDAIQALEGRGEGESVMVCFDLDRECGDFAIGWCPTCPKRQRTTTPKVVEGRGEGEIVPTVPGEWRTAVSDLLAHDHCSNSFSTNQWSAARAKLRILLKYTATKKVPS